jgi:protoheme IX farnesyltransferase
MATFTYTARTYYLLTKPGIVMGNAITMVAGLLLGFRGAKIDFWLCLATLVGLSLVIGSACVFNNYIDRLADQKMARTQNRALVTGLITVQSAIIFAIVIGLIGIGILGFYTNLIASLLAFTGFFIYVVIYSFLKYKSVHATLVGSIAGAMPPVVGYAAAFGHLDLGAFILFAMIVTWQMPHFFAIAIYRMKEYAAANVPVLPLKAGMLATKRQMLIYMIAFTLSSMALFTFGYVGYIYLTVALSLCFIWLFINIQGFSTKDDRLWARKMFFFSLVVMMGVFLTIPISI